MTSIRFELVYPMRHIINNIYIELLIMIYETDLIYHIFLIGKNHLKATYTFAWFSTFNKINKILLLYVLSWNALNINVSINIILLYFSILSF